jgi:hypothetical protein
MEITKLITESIQKKQPISFCKYGDGEFNCANSYTGGNCDNDLYTEKKKAGLIQSFAYMVDNLPNSYMGIWHDTKQALFWEGFVKNPVKWAKYHTIIMDDDSIHEKVEMYKAIQQSNLKKIYICNPLLVKAKILFNIDYMVHVPFNNWFDNHFDELMGHLKNIIQPNEQYIILTSAGMGAKIVISELSKLYPNNIYLDFGSAIDKICTKKTSRGWEPSYEKFMELLKDMIPPEWNDPAYNEIYAAANYRLGIHL